MGSAHSVRRHRLMTWLCWGILTLSCVVTLAACEGDSSEEGPGSVGPVGPVGPVGSIGADEAGVPGSGEITTESRTVDGFDRLVFASEGTVIVTQADAASLAIETDDNLHEYLESEDAGGELLISTAEDIDLAPSRSIIFRVGVTDLSRIELAGAGEIALERLDGTALEVVLSGAGDITIDELQVERVTVGHGGVGTIRLAGAADEQNVTVSGVGSYDSGELASRIAQVEASGTGKATVWVTDDLTLIVSESGSVQFYGSPTVTEDISGLGNVAPLGDK